MCQTDEDYEAWRAVRIAVLPGRAHRHRRRAPGAGLRRPGCACCPRGTAWSSVRHGRQVRDRGWRVRRPRVLPEHRRAASVRAVRPLADHCIDPRLPEVGASVDDEGSLAFAAHFGFVEVDRQVEQVRAGRRTSRRRRRPRRHRGRAAQRAAGAVGGLLRRFGTRGARRLRLFQPLDVSAEQWNASWAGDPMFLALLDGEVIGCAGLHLDTDRPERAENSLTAVRRTWRGRGLAAHLKRRTLHWAATHGVTRSTPGPRRATLDAAPQPAPRLRRRVRQHHREPTAPLPSATIGRWVGSRECSCLVTPPVPSGCSWWPGSSGRRLPPAARSAPGPAPSGCPRRAPTRAARAPYGPPKFVRQIATGETGWFSSPGLVDLDGDGRLEIVAPFYSTFVFDAKGRQLGRGTASEGRVYPPSVVTDLEGDGITDIVVAGNEGTVAAYEFRGGGLQRQGRLAGVHDQRRPVARGPRDRRGRPRRRRHGRGRGDDDQHLADRRRRSSCSTRPAGCSSRRAVTPPPGPATTSFPGRATT